MLSASDLNTQANFLISRHGPAARNRVLKQLADVGRTANSPEIRYWKSLLELITQKLSGSQQETAH